ncbi:hypothetical protein OMO38_11020 [Chryseobacterium sp. 09-1422]|uniref:Uncharacterized protein n=1 Tax=Chryseobacterium kimseyorum TaxID=2984028 RepID=A0ABT3HZB2_9FLAO|nr:hypothetical protein [Chryseobacterium kimseyorum]MCW3169055.1 hypothetical protein [Chryseobacterium kimseyorum]
MKFFKIFVVISIFTILFNCDKIKNAKNKLNPAGPYKEAGIDPFYWEAIDNDKYYIPLVKPLRLIKWKGTDQWILDTSIIGWKYGDMGPIAVINAKDVYVYGLQDVTYDEENNKTSSSFFFIINVISKEINTYDYDNQRKVFEEDIRKLGLPETYFEPHNVYVEYERYPDLEWFPDNVKNQLNKVKVLYQREIFNNR